MQNKSFLYFIILFLSSTTFAQAKQRICYFSFNNQSEVRTTQLFVDQVNEVAPEKIEVKEYLTEQSDPASSFEKMVASGEKCDGLVITGHHTGAFAGVRGAGKLDLEFIEKLSCDPKYADWFRNVNALWLEGCRTMGVGEITPYNEEKETLTVDFHVKRVTNERQADGLAQSVANLDHEFSTTLDQDNPLSSRYMRSFPKAKVFGWTNSAPGEKSNSERSLLFHLAHISKYLDPADGLPEDPVSSYLSPKGLQQYLEAITLSLMPFEYKDRGCEDIAVKGWIDHGTASSSNYLYVFDNPDLKASSSLASHLDPNPMRVKSMECALKAAAQAKDEAKILQVVDQINADPANYSYTLGTMLSVYEELKAKKSKAAATMFERMKLNPQLATFLDKKIHSKQVGFVRRVDYLAIYKELTGYSNSEVEQQLIEKFLREIQTDLPINNKYLRSNASAYRTTLLQALLKSKIGAPYFYDELLSLYPEWDILMTMEKCLSYQGLSRDEQKNLLIRILHSPRADYVVWKLAQPEFKRLNVPASEIQEIYDSLELIPEFQFPEDGEEDLSDPNYSNTPPGRPIAPYPYNEQDPYEMPPPPEMAPKKNAKKSIWGSIFGSSKDKKKKNKPRKD